MIKKILTPVDFSDAAINAVEYASKLAQVLKTELDLINVQRILPISAAVSLGGGAGSGVRENALLASGKLKVMSEEINRMFRISTNYEVEVTSQSLSKTLSVLGKKNTMIVMGTNGADDMGQFFFGTNTYNVIKKAECPVLLVPESFSYGTYKHIVYAFTYEEKGRLALNQFYEFAMNFNARITFLHVSAKDTDISRDVFKAMKGEVEEYFEGVKNLDFKRVFSEDVDDAITGFIHDNPSDLLVMAARHRNIIKNIFGKKPILEGISITTNYPVLVFHS